VDVDDGVGFARREDVPGDVLTKFRVFKQKEGGRHVGKDQLDTQINRRAGFDTHNDQAAARRG
jgi:hypothetical protein